MGLVGDVGKDAATAASGGARAPGARVAPGQTTFQRVRENGLRGCSIFRCGETWVLTSFVWSLAYFVRLHLEHHSLHAQLSHGGHCW